VNPAFKARLLDDATAVVEESGIDNYDGTRFIVLEQTPQVHNLVVCTLCSCYPRPLLGLPPDWYKSRPYRSRAVREPRAVLAEFGTRVPDDVLVRVHDSNANMRYLVMPMRPDGTGGWPEHWLAELVTRDSMIGVTAARSP
jgi:nitrile hydratase